jgi:DNA-binding SARP family transcriptional activator
MSALTLRVLGPFAAAVDGEPLEPFRTKAVQALLVYLACQPEPHPRESLMALLWPEVAQASAAQSLRQTLYLLRQAIPEVSARNSDGDVPLLEADRNLVQLSPEAYVELDVTRFERLVKGTDGDLAKAAQLYRDDFLCDFYLADSAPFEAWALARRELYRRQVLEALDTLAEAAMSRGETAEAEAYARRQLAIDLVHERAHRRLMELLARQGQRSQALAQYERCRQLLADELGAEPSPKTNALYEQIRSAELVSVLQPTGLVRGYELKEELGAGAFGSVYRALQPVVDREVAIKVINPTYASRPGFIRRFEAEARIVARLEHPYIVPLYDYWREPAGAYLVMRYLRGGNLADLIAHGPVEVERTLTIMQQLTAALAVAHGRGVVHRDIKPANILLDEEGNAYMSDFGIAKELVGGAGLTQEGALVGSPAYLSPEQVLGEPVAAQSDVYSLGVVLYEMLTGVHPFKGTPAGELIYKQVSEPLPPTRTELPALPAGVDDVIQRATAKTQAGRFEDARALATALQETLRGTVVPVGIDLGAAELVNPYKGLRPFEEADAAEFYGRRALVAQLVARLAEEGEGSRFLAVVGPSGSGKSSAVKAGLLPALREGAVPGSENWYVLQLTPGTRPLDELEIALLRIAAQQPAGLGEQLARDAYGLARAARLVLPDDGATLLLVIDQFEEVYTAAAEPEQREQFLDVLATAAEDAGSPVRILVTLRADFYDRPLLHPVLGQLMKARTEVVLPLTATELALAIREPAEGIGAAFESGLVPQIVADVAEEGGALPMLQYALTELFNRRDGRELTRAAYEAIGGVSGALARRAEEVFSALSEAEQRVARQLFLRLVTLGEGAEDTRRRTPRSELEALRSEVTDESATIGAVLDTFGQARLLTFDRDPGTREPTAEVAHEALLREWPRLRAWLDDSRSDVRLQRQLLAALGEWQAAGAD